MISLINTIGILLFLFFVLGFAADKIVFNARTIAGKLGIPIVFIGAILGFLTSLPETAIGVNAMMNNLQAMALGNLLGGIVVILCLVLGLSLILNKKISTDGEAANILPIFILILIPLFLGLDGRIGYTDGLLIIAAYLGTLYYLYRQDVDFALAKISITRGSNMAKEWMLLIVSSVVIVVASNMIIKEAALLLAQTSLTPFVVGLIIFSVGTNLPEIAIMLKSWRNGASDLSVSHLLGSAMANILIIGMFAIAKPISVEVNFSFYLLGIYLALISATVMYFYKSDKELTNKEGYILVGAYLLFVFGQIFYWV